MYDVNYHFDSVDELGKKAEMEDNRLAMAIEKKAYAAGYEAREKELVDSVENSDFPEPSDHEAFENVEYFYSAGSDEWNKKGDTWVLEKFDEDTNLYNNHVSVVKENSKYYTVIINYGAYGETVFERKNIFGLAKARSVAIREAVRLAVTREINC